ncbi:MAG: pilus assembly protein PilX [Methylomarinum sp.]|nr:pilus assembly protein PilX [Methylomarinum sp.]
MKNNVITEKSQTGVVLVVSLVMLLLLTLIGLTGMQTTSLEEKMAGNIRNQNLAFQAAESALRAGEAVLTQATLPSFNDTNGMYAEDSAASIFDDLTGTSVWAAATTVTYSTGTLTNIAEDPEYIIQKMPSVGGSGSSLDATSFTTSEYFRVTAMGKGGDTAAVAVVQSIYKR